MSLYGTNQALKQHEDMQMKYKWALPSLVLALPGRSALEKLLSIAELLPHLLVGLQCAGAFIPHQGRFSTIVIIILLEGVGNTIMSNAFLK